MHKIESLNAAYEELGERYIAIRACAMFREAASEFVVRWAEAFEKYEKKEDVVKGIALKGLVSKYGAFKLEIVVTVEDEAAMEEAVKAMEREEGPDEEETQELELYTQLQLAMPTTKAQLMLSALEQDANVIRELVEENAKVPEFQVDYTMMYRLAQDSGKTELLEGLPTPEEMLKQHGEGRLQNEESDE